MSNPRQDRLRALRYVYEKHGIERRGGVLVATRNASGPSLRRYYRADECRVCGGKRDMTLKRVLCRPCYREQKAREREVYKKGKAA